MPSTTPALRAKMQQYFGDEIIDQQANIVQTHMQAAIKYLQSRNFKLTNHWHWSHPTINSMDQLSDQEFDCVVYLIEEWDFGGLKA